MLKKISVKHLKIGMFIHDFNMPWMKHPFLTNKKQLKSPKDLDILLNIGEGEVIIDTEKGGDSSHAYAIEEAQKEIDARLQEDIKNVKSSELGVDAESADAKGREVPFEEELRKAREIYSESRQLLKKLFEEVRLGVNIDGVRTRRTVENMIASIFRNRDALLSLARIKSFHEYTYQHCINVAVLSLNLGMHMGILQDELLYLGVGAVLHDIGKVLIPQALVDKPGPLEPGEYELVKTHAAHGARLVLQAASVPDECAAVALNHHERYNGAGYPRKLSGMEPGKFGLITGLADVYDAMTTNRSYQEGMQPHIALKKVYEWGGTLFHPIYVQKFIQCLGIYPVGSMVKLDSGEVGVVCRQNRDQILRPWVRVAMDVNGKPLIQPLDVDLRKPDKNDFKKFSKSIIETLDPRKVIISVDKLLEKESVEAPEEELKVVIG